jgi:SAM-dependent methyltransferase
MSEQSFSTMFTHALRGNPCSVVGVDEGPRPLPVHHWTREADHHDRELVALCVGPTLDIGCGPGRLSAALAARGHVVLGIDVVPEAVDLTLRRGAVALHRDVFERLPGEGRWRSALLADGNLGIGGDPAGLLRRVRELLDPRGRVVVELAPPGTPTRTVWATLECGDDVSRPFRWSVVGVDAIAGLAREVGLAVRGTYALGERWCAVLEEAA